jgi:Fic family protein
VSSTETSSALDGLLSLPGVSTAVDAARDACTQLRWHQALRRRTAEAAAEAKIRAARASAALAGGRFPVDLVRDVARGASTFPDDAAGRTALGAVRVLSEVDRLGPTWERAPAQALARLHVAAMAGVLPEEVLGRPRGPGEPAGDGADLLDPRGRPVPAPDGAQLPARLSGLTDLLTAPPTSPALVVAALALAEVATLRPFAAGNGLVARALCRAVVVGRGLDPTAVDVWEAALLAAGPRYPLTLARYATGGADGVTAWLLMFAEAVVDGAGEGRAVCDAVVAGRLGVPGPPPS